MTQTTLSGPKKVDAWYYVHVVIMLAFMFGFQFIPPIAPLTALGMNTVGIFLGLLWAWTFVDLLWPSFLGMIAVGLSGFMTIDQAFTAGFGNTTTLMILSVFILAAYLTATGLTRTVAYWFVSRRTCEGRPYIFMFLLLFSCYLLSAFAGGMAAIIVGWAIVYEIANVTGYKPYDKFPVLLLIGTVFASVLGATVFVFRPYAVIALNSAKNILQMDCTFVQWFIPSFTSSFTALVLFVLAAKFLVRPNVTNLIEGKQVFDGFRTQINLTGEQIIGLIVIICVVLFSCLPSFLPAGNPVKVFLAKFSIGPLIIGLLTLVYAYMSDKKHLFDFTHCLSNGVNWQMIIMVASSFPVASMMQSADSGVSALINGWITALLGGYDPYVIAIIFVIFTIIVTQVAHNLVMMIVLAPIICNLSVSLGFNAMPVLLALAFAANAGIATPGASVLGAMVFSNRDWIQVGQAFKYTWLCVAIIAIALVSIAVPLATAMNIGIPLAAA